MNRTYDTNYILNDIYIHGDGTVRLRCFDNNFIFNAIFDQTLPGLRVNKIVDMPSTELSDFPQTRIANKYLRIKSDASEYELVDIYHNDIANIDGGNSTTPYYGHLGAAVGTNNYVQKVTDKTTNTLGDSLIFDDAVTNSQKEVFFTMQMPHAWAGTAVSIHVHWIGNLDDTTAAPIWGLEYTWANIGTVFGNSGIVYTDGKNYTGAGDDADIVAFKHYISEFADITPTASQDGISSILIGRLFRRSGDASDTYDVAGNKCGLLYIDAHYEVNTLGSRAEYSK